MKISDIDANFKLSTTLADESIQWVERFDGAFQIHGACMVECQSPFCRMEPGCLDRMSRDVRSLAYHTAGIRLRFRTNSPFVALKARLASDEDMSHMARSGSSGFDLYTGNGSGQRFRKTFMPEAASDVVTGEMIFPDGGMKDITMDSPLYNGVKTLAVGLKPGAAVESATPYRHRLPVVFYGSSITQGGCASRPGNSYQLILSRLLDTDIINLGFSGSAKGEPEMADYIGSLAMSAFVLDYDHNAPSVQHLQDTHYDFYHTIRAKQPNLPIVMVSKPDFDLSSKEHVSRRSAIFETYQRALEAEDQHVYFIDGERMFGTFMRDSCTVDGCHPNDLGFMRMAEAIYPTLDAVLV